MLHTKNRVCIPISLNYSQQSIKLYNLFHVFHTKPSIVLLVLSPSSVAATCLTNNVLQGSIRTGAHGKYGKQEPSIMTATLPAHNQTQDLLLAENNNYGILLNNDTVKLNGNTNNKRTLIIALNCLIYFYIK